MFVFSREGLKLKFIGHVTLVSKRCPLLYSTCHASSRAVQLCFHMLRSAMEVDWEALKTELAHYNQDHLLQYLPELSEAQKAELYGDIREIDFSKVERYFSEARLGLTNSEEKKDELLQPLDSSICGSTARDTVDASRWEKIGTPHLLIPPP